MYINYWVIITIKRRIQDSKFNTSVNKSSQEVHDLAYDLLASHKPKTHSDLFDNNRAFSCIYPLTINVYLIVHIANLNVKLDIDRSIT